MHDLIVIGAGSGGLNIGLTMSRLGLRVLIVDRTDRHIGGECLNAGCVPSKALLHVARVLAQARQARRFGFQVAENTDWEAVKQHIRTAQESIRTHENAAWLRKTERVDVELGTARFSGPDEVTVNNRSFRAKRIVIATGSSPRRLGVPGSENVDFLTNETIFEMPRLPKHLLIVGAGPQGVEMAQAFARLGSAVTVVSNGDRIMERELPELTEILLKGLENEGVAFKFNCEVSAFADAHTARLTHRDGAAETVPFDAVLLAAGRTHHWDELNLPAAGIATENGRLKVDAFLRTTNRRVWAAGDAAGPPYFTHAAELHASVLLNNFLSPLPKRISYDHFSWVTFTDPELATFGLSPDEIVRRGIRHEKLVLDLTADDRAVTDARTEGRLVLYIRPDRLNPLGAKLLGGSVLAPNAGETVQELILARQQNLSVGALFNKIYPYPTATRMNKWLLTEHFSATLPDWLKKVVKWLY